MSQRRTFRALPVADLRTPAARRTRSDKHHLVKTNPTCSHDVSRCVSVALGVVQFVTGRLRGASAGIRAELPRRFRANTNWSRMT